jgi:hypothetical protein
MTKPLAIPVKRPAQVAGFLIGRSFLNDYSIDIKPIH